MKYALELDSKEAATLVALITLGRYVLDQPHIADLVFAVNAPPGIMGCVIALSGTKSYQEFDEIGDEKAAEMIQANVKHVMGIVRTFMVNYIEQEFPQG